MSYVPSRNFCCCLPVRFGVIIIALLGLFVGGVVAIGGIYEATRLQNPDTTTKVAYGIAITIYALYALMSLLALIGAIAKQRGLIRAFFVFFDGPRPIEHRDGVVLPLHGFPKCASIRQPVHHNDDSKYAAPGLSEGCGHLQGTRGRNFHFCLAYGNLGLCHCQRLHQTVGRGGCSAPKGCCLP